MPYTAKRKARAYALALANAQNPETRAFALGFLFGQTVSGPISAQEIERLVEMHGLDAFRQAFFSGALDGMADHAGRLETYH